MVTKPLYGKILTSRSFDTQAQAIAFAKEYKSEYKQADMSIKFDINRTASSEWTATVYLKV